jgi:hypothetical protein
MACVWTTVMLELHEKYSIHLLIQGQPRVSLMLVIIYFISGLVGGVKMNSLKAGQR